MRRTIWLARLEERQRGSAITGEDPLRLWAFDLGETDQLWIPDNLSETLFGLRVGIDAATLKGNGRWDSPDGSRRLIAQDLSFEGPSALSEAAWEKALEALQKTG